MPLPCWLANRPGLPVVVVAAVVQKPSLRSRPGSAAAILATLRFASGVSVQLRDLQMILLTLLFDI